MFELSLVRLFSIAMYSSVAFMSVSFALFGLALGGMVVYFAPKYFSAERFEERAGRYTFWYGISLVFFILLFLQVNFNSQGGDNAWHGIYLSGLAFYLSAAPFFLANICLSYVFKIRGSEIGLLYFSDLIGAGLGVIAAVVCMSVTSTVNVVFFSAGVALLSAMLFFGKGSVFRILSCAIAAVIFALTIFNYFSNDLDITYNKKGKEENVVFSKWNSFSRVTVKKEATPEPGDSLPEGIELSRVEQMGIEIDSDAYTPILRFDGDMEKVSFLKNDLSGLAYRFMPKGDVLIIGPGGGRDVLSALHSGNTVHGVEINPIIADDIMKGAFKDFSGSLYSHPNVDVVVAEGRSFIHNDTRAYSVIQLPLIDTWASTLNGNFALVENYLYTVEALEDYISHLTKNGVLSISRWELDGVRLVPMYAMAAEKLGIEKPELNVAIVKNSKKGIVALNNYLFKKEPFTKAELDQIDALARENNFEVMYSPRVERDNAYYGYFFASDKEAFMSTFDRNIRPSYDDKPFFFFVVNPSQLFLPSEETVGRFSKIDGGLGRLRS
jgi:hypothetical protein